MRGRFAPPLPRRNPLEFNAAPHTPKPWRRIAGLQIATAAIHKARCRCFVGDVRDKALNREILIQFPCQAQIELGEGGLAIKHGIDGLAKKRAGEIQLRIRRKLAEATNMILIWAVRAS